MSYQSDPIYENDDKSKGENLHFEDAASANDATHHDYAQNKYGQVTVAGTMGQDPDHKPNIPMTAWIILGLCALAQFQNTFFGIAPAANSYPIAGALNGMDTRIWIIQAQAVPGIVTGPIMSIIADLYGRRWVIIGVWALFCISAIIAMTAKSMSVLILAQALAGCSAGVSGLMFAVASEVLPSRYRSHAQTVVGAFSGLSAFPALFGMAAATSNDPVNGWRWIFRTRLIMEGIILVGFFFFYKPPARTAERTSWGERFKRLDWIGYFLLMGGLVPLLVGFAFASDRNYGWKSAISYGCVAAGFAGFIACLAYETWGTKTGFLHHALFQEGRNFPILIFVIAVEGSLFYLVNNIYPNQVYTIWVPAGGLKAAAWLIPFFMTVTVLAPFLSIYVTKSRDIKWPICGGFIFFTAAVVGFAMSQTNAMMGIAFNVVAGIGFVAPLILVMTAVQLSTPPLFIGVASALTISARTLGGTVGLAISEVIYANISDSKIGDYISSATIPLGFNPQYLGQLIVALLSHGPTATIPGITDEILGAANAAAAAAYAYAFKITWFSFLPATFVAAVAVAFLRNPGDRMDWVVDAPLDADAQRQAPENLKA